MLEALFVASIPVRVVWSQTQNLLPDGATVTTAASEPVVGAPLPQPPTSESEHQEIPVSWHNPATPRPTRPIELSLDKRFRVPLGRKRMLSPEEERSPTQSADGTTPAEESPSSSPTAANPKRSCKQDTHRSSPRIIRPNVTMTRKITLNEGQTESATSSASPVPSASTVPSASAASPASAASTDASISTVLGSSGSKRPTQLGPLFSTTVPAAAATATGGSVPVSPGAQPPQNAGQRVPASTTGMAAAAAVAAAALTSRSGVTLKRLGTGSDTTQSWAKPPTPSRPDKEEAPSPLTPHTPEMQPPMIALFDQRATRTSSGSNSSESGGLPGVRTSLPASAEARRSCSLEETSGVARSSAERRRFCSAGLTTTGSHSQGSGFQNVAYPADRVGAQAGTSDASGSVVGGKETRRRTPSGSTVGLSAEQLSRSAGVQAKPRSPQWGRVPSPAEMSAASNNPGTSTDAFILRNCAPRDLSKRHSSAEDPGSCGTDAAEVEMQVVEPAEELHLAAAEAAGRSHSAGTAGVTQPGTAPEPSSGATSGSGRGSMADSVALSTAPGSSAAPNAAPSPLPMPPPSGGDPGVALTHAAPTTPHSDTAAASDVFTSAAPGPSQRRVSTESGPSQRKSSDSSAHRRRSSDPLVSLTSETAASAKRDELTHVVRMPESVASGEASLAWEPARDPLGICFPAEMLYQPPERGPTSPNVSYCVLCWDGGDLLLCDSCDRAFHRECYVGPVGDEEDDSTWFCLMCRVMPLPLSPLDRRPKDTMNEQDMTLARRLLTELCAAYYPAMYLKNLENMSLQRSVNSFSRAWLKRILMGAKPKLSDGFSKQSAFHFSLYSICQPFKHQKLPEFANIERPVYLDEIKRRLLNNEFSKLMIFLRTTKKLVDQIRFFKKGTAVHKYLKELDEKFEQFLQQHMKDYWLQLDDETSSK